MNALKPGLKSKVGANFPSTLCPPVFALVL